MGNILWTNKQPTNWTLIGTTSAMVASYSDSSIVFVRNIVDNEYDLIKIKDLDIKLHQVYDLNTREFVDIKEIKCKESSEPFVLIKKDSLGEDMPMEDFYVVTNTLVTNNTDNTDNSDSNISSLTNALQTSIISGKLYDIYTEKPAVLSVNNIAVVSMY